MANKREEAVGITIKHQRLNKSGVLARGLSEEVLLMDFLAKVSTKLDLTDRATEVNVARRRRVRSVGEGVPVVCAEEAEISLHGVAAAECLVDE